MNHDGLNMSKRDCERETKNEPKKSRQCSNNQQREYSAGEINTTTNAVQMRWHTPKPE